MPAALTSARSGTRAAAASAKAAIETLSLRSRGSTGIARPPDCVRVSGLRIAATTS